MFPVDAFARELANVMHKTNTWSEDEKNMIEDRPSTLKDLPLIEKREP